MRLNPPVDSLKLPRTRKLPNFRAKKFNSDRKKFGSFSPKIREWKKLLNFFLQNSPVKLPSIKKECPGNQKNGIFFRRRVKNSRIFRPPDGRWLSTPALADSLRDQMAIHPGAGSVLILPAFRAPAWRHSGMARLLLRSSCGHSVPVTLRLSGIGTGMRPRAGRRSGTPCLRSWSPGGGGRC